MTIRKPGPPSPASDPPTGEAAKEQYRETKFKEQFTPPHTPDSKQKRSDRKAPQEKVQGSGSTGIDGGPGMTKDKWWLWGFLLHTLIYLGGSAYVNWKAMSLNKQVTTNEISDPIDLDMLIKLCGSVAVGTAAAFFAFLIIIWRHPWYYWTILGIIGVASGVPFGVTVWRSNSSGGGMYYAGLVILGAIFLCGAWAAVLPSRRKRRTIIMLGAFRDTIGDRIRTYWFIIAWSLLQVALDLWCTLSAAAVIIVFQPGSNACKASEDSWCDWDTVSAIISVYIFAQLWLSTTLSEVANATLSAGVFSRLRHRAKGSSEGTEIQSPDCKTEIRQSLKKASYRSLGSLARNAFFSDTVEMLCWPLECVFDRVPVLNRKLARWLDWYLIWLCGLMERYNKFIGITIVLEGFALYHKSAREGTQCLVKSGHKDEALKEEGRANTLGKTMGPITTKLRGELKNDWGRPQERMGRQEKLENGYWISGLGALMGATITKQLLGAGALGCGLTSAGVMYSILICMAAVLINGDNIDTQSDPTITLGGWSWGIIGWSFISGYTIAYHLFMTVEACICSIYWMLLKSSSRVVRKDVHTVDAILREPDIKNPSINRGNVSSTMSEWDDVRVMLRL